MNEIKKTTWGEIKLATLQKLFSSNGLTVNMDSSTSEYIYAMPQTANEALQMLATAGKFLVDEVEVVNRPVPNLLDTGFQNVQLFGQSETFRAKAKAFYFEAQGKLTAYIQTGENTGTIAIDSNNYETYKGLIDNPDAEEVLLYFEAEYPSNIRNVCLYEYSFVDDERVPDYREYLRYRMKTLVPDFYQFMASELYKDDETGYEVADGCYQEADQTFVIPREKEGIFRIYYKAYPPLITQSTPDDYELPLDPEVATLLPLYMASQLYKDDDNSIATVYRNEFEVAFDRLSNGVPMQRKEEFTSISGW